ncbi:hypothetical protein BH11MYX3_BH11MYX3_31010 [soil metagenome]
MNADGESGDETDPLIGRELASRYRIETLLGEGAMGAVYRARHVKVGRSFAVKVLHDRLLTDSKQKRRFERESELAGKLHHINVVGVVDVGETDDGIHFMVMEYADGPTLGSMMLGPIAPARVVTIVKQLLDGLAHAHEYGLIHRDFKPDNVIVETDRSGNERPRIVDFGIAVLRDSVSQPDQGDRLTTAGLVLGTPHYMAPEHAMGAGIDHRIDLFALGVIVFEMLTGMLPFDGDGVDVARANLLNETPPMGVRVPHVSVDPLLEAFTRRLMEKQPDARPATAKAARALLELIERDRDAAAAALGIASDAVTRLPRAAEVALVAATPTMSAPTARAMTGDPTTDRVGRAPIQLPRRRVIAIGAGIAAVLAIVILVKLATGGTSEPAAAVASVAPSVALPDASDAEPATDAAVSAPVDAPPVADAETPPIDAPRAAVKVATPTPRPRPRPTPTIEPVVPAVTDTSASAVAQLYGVVGRELKQLDTAKGSGATSNLWPRYLRIRINDVLTTPEKRTEAQRALAQLRAEIAAHGGPTLTRH